MTAPPLARLLAAGLLLVALFAGLARGGGPLPEQSATLYVFGTLVEIVYHDTPAEEAQAATAALERQFRHFHKEWHAWQDGELGRLNAAIARGEAMEVSSELAALLRQGQALSQESGGLFEPAIGKLIALWGFHGDLPPEGPLPDPQAIEDLRNAKPRMADLHFEENRIWSDNPDVQLDLGAYAKGAALDRAAESLARLGISNAVLNAGGDINVLGRHGARGWRVAIRNPLGWGAVAALTVQPGEAVYTSGNYERFLEQDGTRFSHILDPRTGWPAGEIVSATVLGRDGARADAAATALSVAGPEGWAEVAQSMGIEAALLIDSEGRLLATPAMAARLERISGADPLPLTVVVPVRPGQGV